MSNSIRKYNFETETYFKIKASDLEEIIEEHFKLEYPYDLAESQMWLDEYNAYKILDAVASHKYDIDAAQVISDLKKGYNPYGLHHILNQMAIDGAIPIGKYLIYLDRG